MEKQGFIACCININKTELFLITQILHVLVNNIENVTFSRKVSTFQRKHISALGISVRVTRSSEMFPRRSAAFANLQQSRVQASPLIPS